MNIKETLKTLCSPVGVSGAEYAAANVAKELLSRYMTDVKIDDFGNVTGSIKYGDDLPVLLIDAHIDEIGMVVNYIDEKGFATVCKAGGIDRRALPAASVNILGLTNVKGVICAIPPHVSKDDGTAIKEDEIAIDCGMTKAELEKLISPGDRVIIDSDFSELKNGRINARALDNRAGVCAVLYALDLLLLKEAKPAYNLTVVFSSQEEIGLRGAKIAAYNAGPDLAIIVDVSYGDYPLVDEKKTGKLGGGPMLGIAPSLDRELWEKVKRVAESKGIAVQTEVMSGETSTNADVISVTRSGVKCALLSIPLRNMHTAAEVVDLSDIEATGKLIFELIQNTEIMQK